MGAADAESHLSCMRCGREKEQEMIDVLVEGTGRGTYVVLIVRANARIPGLDFGTEISVNLYRAPVSIDIVAVIKHIPCTTHGANDVLVVHSMSVVRCRIARPRSLHRCRRNG